MQKIIKLNLIIIFTMVGCVGIPPVIEYNLAKTAIDSAKENGAAQFSPGYLHKAHDQYRKGISHYDEREYDDAYDNFYAAKKDAERSENKTRLMKYKSGESF